MQGINRIEVIASVDLIVRLVWLTPRPSLPRECYTSIFYILPYPLE